MNCVLLYGYENEPTTKSAGPFRIASELRKHGYTVNCIDISSFNYIKGDIKEILESIITKDTLWVGISSSFLYQILGLKYFRFEINHKKIDRELENQILTQVRFLKQLNPDIEIITGGSRVFQLEKYGFRVFDRYVDAEILEFTNRCRDKTLNKFDTSTIIGKDFKEFSNSMITYVEEDIINPWEVLPIEISRGCIFRCKFCSFPMNGKSKGEWIKQEAVLLDEFKRNYEKFGVTNYLFADDTYNDSVDKVKRLYDNVFSKLDFKIKFTTYLRLDLMVRYPETIEYLHESGLKSAVFGIETLNHRSGKAIGKGMNPLDLTQFIKELKLNQFKDILTFSGFIIGLPHDTEDTAQELKEFLLSDDNYLDQWEVSVLHLNPKLYHKKNNYSLFDLEYEKYGYDVWEDRSEHNSRKQIKWKNHLNGLHFDKCFDDAENIMDISRKSSKFKIAGFYYNFYTNLQIPESEIMSLPAFEIIAKYDIESLKAEKSKAYIERLKSFYILGNKS